MPDTHYLTRLTRAGQRLARDLTEIDATVRVIQSRPDWLTAAADELAVTQRSLEFSVEKIKAARARYAVLVTDGWRDWPASDETKFRELIAAVETLSHQEER